MPETKMLMEKSAQCRRLAQTIGDQRTGETLRGMAADYERQAREYETPRVAGQPVSEPPNPAT